MNDWVSETSSWAGTTIWPQGATYKEVKWLRNFNGQWFIMQQPGAYFVLQVLGSFLRAKLAFKVAIGSKEISVGLGLDAMDDFSSYMISCFALSSG